jgi:hypothetical protein
MALAHRTFRTVHVAALAVAMFCGLGLRCSAAFAQDMSYSQDEIEAAFLYRFAGFVSWPQGELPASVFTVAVLDDDALAADLDHMLAHNELKGRRAQVRRITSVDQLGDAQILYVGGSDESKLKRRLAPIAGRPVLVVTSQPGALDDGSTINFLVIDRHVRFEISLAAARRSGLTISADLLSVATHIEGSPVGSQAPCEMSPSRAQLQPCSPRLASE